MQNQTKNLSLALAALLLGSLLTGLIMSLPQGMRSDLYAEQLDNSQEAKENLSTAQGLSSAFRNVAEALRPSVVSVRTTQTAGGSGRQALPPGLRRQLPPGFEDFFGGGGSLVPQPRQREGMGSGVIVRPDGYILTNNHVVENADELTVELSDGRIVTGEVVGTDPETDLAVLKVDLTGLQAVTFGSSDDIRVGDWVLAIGSPFGLDQTVTAGIISGKNRVQGIVSGGDGFEDFLQTDAAINPGNSGGPLVNLRGELVGINTAILSRSGGSAGIGFAIPVSLANPVLNAIIEHGEVHRGFLGAQVADVNPQVVKEFGLSADNGALIRGVLEGKPAANAGLQPGDVVTQLDGRQIRSSSQLRNYIASRPPGATVKMQVNRNGNSMQFNVTLQERTDAAMAMFDGGVGGLFGAELTPVTPETARQYGYEDLQNGLIVTQVEDGGLAAQGDLQVGDVIETAGGQQINSVEQLAEVFRESREQQIPLRIVVRRGNTRMLLVIR